MPDPPAFDEAGAVPATLMSRVAELQPRVMDHVRSRGVRFSGSGGDGVFVVDPVPRVIDSETWTEVAAGLAQRARALDLFVADAHGPRRSVTEGVVPARLIDSCANFDPGASSLGPPEGRNWIGIAGLDLVRDTDGRFLVLEDNCRTPSGLAYAMAAREALTQVLDDGELDLVRSYEGVPQMLRDVLDAQRPDPSRQTKAVLLSDGPKNSAYYEHRKLAMAMDIPLVTPSEIVVRGDELWCIDGDTHIDVVYRRTDSDLSDGPIGGLLAPALRAGTIGLVNAFGTGISDDKLTHAYVEDLIRFLLGEEPLLPSVPSLDLGTDDGLEQALDRLEELVVKPRDGFGGIGVTICSELDADALEQVRGQLRAEPASYIAQERVALSTHPTVVDGRPRPRHVDLRPFVMMAGETVHVVPGGLTRVAMREGSMIVNSSQDGGAKDTWVMR